jgi:hypothetical protein
MKHFLAFVYMENQLNKEYCISENFIAAVKHLLNKFVTFSLKLLHIKYSSRCLKIYRTRLKVRLRS